MEQLFAELDTNQDGRIDEEEFRQLDVNKDGRVDFADMVEHEKDFISVSKLQDELSFRDESRTACQAGTMFLM